MSKLKRRIKTIEARVINDRIQLKLQSFFLRQKYEEFKNKYIMQMLVAGFLIGFVFVPIKNIFIKKIIEQLFLFLNALQWIKMYLQFINPTPGIARQISGR